MGRSKAWHSVENAQICRSWLAVSQDATIGTAKNSKKIWEKVSTCFNESMISIQKSKDRVSKLASLDILYVVRSEDAVEKQWRAIQKACVIFQGCNQTAEDNKESGTGPEEVMAQAFKLYEDDTNQEEFKFQNCWEILKDTPKFSSLVQESNERKKKKRPKPMITPDKESENGIQNMSENPMEFEIQSVDSPSEELNEKQRPESGNKKARFQANQAQMMIREIQTKEKLVQVQMEKNDIALQVANDQLFLGMSDNDPLKQEYFNLRRRQQLKNSKKSSVSMKMCTITRIEEK